MKTIVPNYYPKFSCIAGACRHSCCVGWEIDIDPESLARFRAVPGAIGARLKESICENADGACFCLDEDDRCPFLNGDGLCDLILELGSDCLCQICADHPRFRNFFSDREEIGLGLCCEAAARLILEQAEPVRMIVLEDDGGDCALSGDEAFILHLRTSAISALQNRSLRFEERVDDMLRALHIPQLRFHLPDWAAFLLDLERLDDVWTDRLQALTSAPSLPLPCAPETETAFEQLAVYLLTRHLPGALEDGDIAGRIACAVLILHLINALCAAEIEIKGAFRMDDLVEIARMYSSEIEYSDENLYAILDELHRVFPELRSIPFQ